MVVKLDLNNVAETKKKLWYLTIQKSIRSLTLALFCALKGLVNQFDEKVFLLKAFM